MDERVDIVIVGAGPAGLRAAEVLAGAGRDVLVVERQRLIGPKPCAGGLSLKAVRELAGLGLPHAVGLDHVPVVSVDDGPGTGLDRSRGLVRTISRGRLGQLQSAWARRAGAEIACGVEVSDIDLSRRRLRVGGRQIRYEHLVGADGSASRVRRALGLPIHRAYFAGEFNVPGLRAGSLLVAFDSPRLASGYFWIFPHEDYTSIGAGAPTALVRPAVVRQYLERRVRTSGFAGDLPPFEAAMIEVEFVGFHFGRSVHLVGDAAGVASGLTGEGIYPALITGEEIARQILDPAAPRPKTTRWLRLKRMHDALARLWLSRPARTVSFAVLAGALRTRRPRQWATSLFLGG